MTRRIAHLLSLAAVLGLLFSCGKSKEEEPVAAAPVGPPAAVMAEIAAWKAVGGVTDLRDLAPKPAAPGTPNAAELHRPLIDVLGSMSESEQTLVHDVWESPITSLKYVVESYEKELATIKEAVALPYCNWGTNFEEGPDAKLPYLSYGRTAARLLTADARVRAAGGDYDGAAHSLLGILRLADQCASEPLTICVLVRISLDALAAEGIKNILKDQTTAPSDLLDSLLNRNHRAYLRKAYLAAGADAIHAQVKLAGGTQTTLVAEQSMSDAIAKGLIWDLQTLRLFAEQSNRPHYQMTAPTDAQPLPADARVPELHMDIAMLSRVSSNAAGVENLVNEAILALQLREYKAKHGEYPDPATFKVPDDALTGEPIVYLRRADGFTLRVARAGLSGQNDEYEWEW